MNEWIIFYLGYDKGVYSHVIEGYISLPSLMIDFDSWRGQLLNWDYSDGSIISIKQAGALGL